MIGFVQLIRYKVRLGCEETKRTPGMGGLGDSCSFLFPAARNMCRDRLHNVFARSWCEARGPRHRKPQQQINIISSNLFTANITYSAAACPLLR